MGYDCPCGTSVGTRAHWCEWKQEVHARRMEALLIVLVGAVAQNLPNPELRRQVEATLARIASEADE